MADLDQISINITDVIPPENFATIDKGSLTGNTYDKIQVEDRFDLVKQELTEELSAIAVSGVKGEATLTSSPTPYNSTDFPKGLYEKWEVKTAGTYTNFKDGATPPLPIVITTDDLDKKLAYINVTNGVSKKEVITLPTETPSSLVISSNTADPVNGKAVADYSPSKTSLGFKVFNIGDNIAPELSNSNFSDAVNWGNGYFDNTGNIITVSTIKYTKTYYPIVTGSYTCNIQLATSVPMSIIIYDANKNFVSAIVNKPNTDWSFSVPQNGFIRFSKLVSQAAELDYCKTLQVYDKGLSDDVIVTRLYADNNLLKTTDRIKIETIIQPKFFLNATRNIDYSAFTEIRLTGGNEADLKDSSGNWLELYLVFIRVKELNGTTNTLIQIAKKNTATGVVAVNNISVASGTTKDSIVDVNGFLKITLLPVAGSNLTFDVFINVNKLSVADDTNKDLGATLQLNTHYLFETKKQANLNISKTVVCLGDSITEFGNYPSDMASLNGWTVYNCGFGGCRMGRHNLPNSAGPYYNEMCFHKVANTIATGDYTAMEAAAEYLATNVSDDNRPIVARLKAINWNLVDYIVVAYGTNDYAATTSAGGISMGVNTDVLADGSTFKGAINYGIKRILETYPHIQLVFTTPIYRMRYIGVNDGLNSDIFTNDRGYMLRDYANAIVEISDLNHVESLDLNKNSGINKYTAASKYIIPTPTDGVHPTPLGYNLLARRIGGKIKTLF